MNITNHIFNFKHIWLAMYSANMLRGAELGKMVVGNKVGTVLGMFVGDFVGLVEGINVGIVEGDIVTSVGIIVGI